MEEQQKNNSNGPASAGETPKPPTLIGSASPAGHGAQPFVATYVYAKNRKAGTNTMKDPAR
jgi:hypothetical protein